MVIIRLSRKGIRKRPFYNIVVIESKNSRNGKFLEKIGFYNPCIFKKKERFNILEKRLLFWKKLGVQLSNTVNRLIKYYKKI